MFYVNQRHPLDYKPDALNRNCYWKDCGREIKPNNLYSRTVANQTLHLPLIDRTHYCRVKKMKKTKEKKTCNLNTIINLEKSHVIWKGTCGTLRFANTKWKLDDDILVNMEKQKEVWLRKYSLWSMTHIVLVAFVRLS